MKYFFVASALALFFLSFVIYQVVSLNDGKFHVTVCNVGQGDAVVLRTPQGKVILFDGGPDNSVLNCLSSAMPFWQRKIDLVLLSHPHADHLNGLVDVFATYEVGQFATEDLANTSDGYKALQLAVKKEGIRWQTMESSDLIKTSDGVRLRILGPSREYISATAVDGKYITSSEFASLIVLVSYKDFDLLLNGDAQSIQLGQIVTTQSMPELEVLQVPHHGSRTGLTAAILARLHPKLATISVGKNSYGHPAPNTLSLLQKADVAIHRTDKEGDLRLISDGMSYKLQ